MLKSKQNKNYHSVKGSGSRNYTILLLYILIALSIIAYALQNNIIIGVIAFVLIIVTLAMEFKASVKEEGIRKSIYDIGIALVAVFVFWLLLSIILDTSSPIDVVASCSMLPSLQRGDIVALHGISNISSFLSLNNVPVINVSPSMMNKTVANMDSEFLAFYAYNPNNASEISDIIGNGNFPVALYNTKCLSTFASVGSENEFYRCRINGNQGYNLIKYNYSIGNVNNAGIVERIVETRSITIGNHTIFENYSNPIIVYRTIANDTFSGDIIHRLYAAIKSGNNYYFLTKGDNNPGLDIEFGNYPVVSKDVVGYVVGTLPMIGYLKLIISGQLSAVTGCNSTIIR